jgi:hypothetical protein
MRFSHAMLRNFCFFGKTFEPSKKQDFEKERKRIESF